MLAPAPDIPDPVAAGSRRSSSPQLAAPKPASRSPGLLFSPPASKPATAVRPGSAHTARPLPDAPQSAESLPAPESIAPTPSGTPRRIPSASGADCSRSNPAQVQAPAPHPPPAEPPSPANPPSPPLPQSQSPPARPSYSKPRRVPHPCAHFAQGWGRSIAPPAAPRAAATPIPAPKPAASPPVSPSPSQPRSSQQ